MEPHLFPPTEDGSDPLSNAIAIEGELKEYSGALMERPIWLVLSKVDQLEDDALESLIETFTARFPDRPLHAISALGDIGLPELTQALMRLLDEYRRRLLEDEAFAEYDETLSERISEDVIAHSERMRAQSRLKKLQRDSDDDRPDDDDDATEVIYVAE